MLWHLQQERLLGCCRQGLPLACQHQQNFQICPYTLNSDEGTSRYLQELNATDAHAAVQLCQ
jgi:hypothetical protein